MVVVVGGSQVGGAAVWNIKCKGSCGEDLAPLKTSAPLYGDDFEINQERRPGVQ